LQAVTAVHEDQYASTIASILTNPNKTLTLAEDLLTPVEIQYKRIEDVVNSFSSIAGSGYSGEGSRTAGVGEQDEPESPVADAGQSSSESKNSYVKLNLGTAGAKSANAEY
ncbi:hypothetical protein HK102_008933, partial [Quaeritorhiza haematococci]